MLVSGVVCDNKHACALSAASKFHAGVMPNTVRQADLDEQETCTSVDELNEQMVTQSNECTTYNSVDLSC